MDEINEEEPLIRKEIHTNEIDIGDRDPKQINQEVDKVDFEDLIAEPDGIHSLDGVWKCSFQTFTQSKRWFYRTLTFIFGVPLSLLWGLLFAFLSFGHIWVVGPCFKSCLVEFNCLCRPLLRVIKTCFYPLFKVAGKIVSRVKGFVRKEA